MESNVIRTIENSPDRESKKNSLLEQIRKITKLINANMKNSKIYSSKGKIKEISFCNRNNYIYNPEIYLHCSKNKVPLVSIESIIERAKIIPKILNKTKFPIFEQNDLDNICNHEIINKWKNEMNKDPCSLTRNSSTPFIFKSDRLFSNAAINSYNFESRVNIAEIKQKE